MNLKYELLAYLPRLLGYFRDESEIRKSNAETIMKFKNLNFSDESENLYFWNESEI